MTCTQTLTRGEIRSPPFGGTGIKAEHVTEKPLKFINSFILQKQEAIKHIIVISS